MIQAVTIPAPDQSHQPLSANTALIAVRRWWTIALPLGIIFASCAAAVIYLQEIPRYTASHWLVIHERVEDLLPDARNDDSRKFVSNQMELLKSPPVLDPVAAQAAIVGTPELEGSGDRDISGALRKQLRVTPKGQSEYFVVEFTSVDPIKAAAIVNAVAKSYITMQRRSDDMQSDRMIQLLQEQQRHHAAIAKLNRENYISKSIQATGKDPFALESKTQTIAVRHPLESQMAAAEIETMLMKAQIQAGKELLAKTSFTAPQTEIDKMVAQHPQVAGLRNQIAQAKATLAEHEKKSLKLDQNRSYLELKERTTKDEAALADLLARLPREIGQAMVEQAQRGRGDEISEKEQRVETAELTMQILKDQFKAAVEAQQEYKGYTLEVEFARAEYERSAKVVEALNSEIQRRNMAKHSLARVESFREATVPVTPDGSISLKKVLGGGGAAFFVPFGLAFLLEVLYRRVDSRKQLESLGELMVVGEVTELPKRSRRPGANARRDSQLFEESINGLRTYLSLSDTLQDVRVLAVTSAVSREGKTSLSAQLAMSIAKATGESVLILDGDMRSPDIHHIFGVACKPGLAEVLRGECHVDTAIETSAHERVHVLTAGILSSSPHHIMGRGEFQKLVAKLRESYRYIVIDTPPILPASEALVMARTADAAVLCVRRDYSRIDQVNEAHQRLKSSGAKTIGAVLSGIPARHYAYKYGGYYYSQRGAVVDQLPGEVQA